MRKILIALALIASVQIASAQSKSPAEAKKAVEAAELAAQNPKKAVKPATWLKVADAYVKAYDAPTGSVVAGATKQELMFMMGNEKPTSTEEVVIGGQPYTKEVYANKDLYFNANGQLAIIDVTQPVYEDALAKAIEAYKKAAEVDPALSKGKDIRAGLELISGKYINDAYNCYQFGDYAEASVLFEKAADAMETAPLNKMDTTAIYNAGFTAWISKDYSRAQKFFEKCLANNYYYEGGEVFAKLADVYTNLGQKDAARDVLEKGFTTYPQSQSILIGLINYYLESGQNTDRLFVLINEAKKNEPDNASLYYVEGNIYKELGKTEDAVKAYYKCADPIVKSIPQIDRMLTQCTDSFILKNPLYGESSSALVKLCLLEFIKQKERTQQSKLCEDVLTYIHENYSDPTLTNEEIAYRFNYHPYHLSRLIKRETGKTLHKYLIYYRLQIAKACENFKSFYDTEQNRFWPPAGNLIML